MTPEEREELKAIIREAVAEELDERLRKQNERAILSEQAYWRAYNVEDM